MSTRAPAACSVRAISAPTRRAPPVISTTWSAKAQSSREELSVGAGMRLNDTGLCVRRVPVRDAVLSAEEAVHTARVAERLAEEIAAAGGWISFERYMDIALY